MVSSRPHLALFLGTNSLSMSSKSMSSWLDLKSSEYPQIERNQAGEIVSVPTSLTFVTPDTVAPFTRRDASGVDGPFEGVTWDIANVLVHNGRLQNLTLEQNGFQLVTSDIPNDIDFYNMRDVVDRYYPICRELVRKHLGEDVQVFAFDHNVRSNGDRRTLENGNGALVQDPLGIVHADYTVASAPKRLEQLAQLPKKNDVHRQFLKENETLLDPDQVEQVLCGRRRFGMINVWRNINRQSPVLQRPLACMDAQFTAVDKLRTFSIHYADRVGENYFAVNHPDDQRWFYFPEMTHQEAILLKQWDSFGNLAKDAQPPTDFLSTFAVHSAFVDPSSPSDAPPRESIEVRCVIMYPEVTGDER